MTRPVPQVVIDCAGFNGVAPLWTERYQVSMPADGRPNPTTFTVANLFEDPATGESLPIRFEFTASVRLPARVPWRTQLRRWAGHRLPGLAGLVRS